MNQDPTQFFRSYRATQTHATALIDPSLDTFETLVTENIQLSKDWSLPFASSLQAFRDQARRELLLLAQQHTQAYRDTSKFSVDAPFVMSGHQPELFHPGVWFKNFALSNLGKQLGATPINLVVDNDVCQHTAVKIPVSSAGRIRTESVAFDKPGESLPFEQLQISDPAAFRTFANRLTTALRPLIEDPSVQDLWQEAALATESTANLGTAIAQARHRLEGRVGLDTLELPLSKICGGQAFCAFAISVVTQIETFQDSYNQSVIAYRRAHGIRSTSHPVPELRRKGQWLETPFWIYSDSQPQRRPVFVRPLQDRIEFSDLHSTEFDVETRSIESAATQLSGLQSQHQKLRPRALATTMFARLVLSDLFLHGIGGGKYDQLCDMIIRDFFEIEPPDFAVLSATYAPLGTGAIGEDDALKNIKHAIRDTKFHPERFQRDVDFPQAILNRKRELLENIPPAGARKAWHDELSGVNNKLSDLLSGTRDGLDASLAEAVNSAADRRILQSREYSWCVYPLQEMTETLSRLAGSI